ncbi:MAG: hypothetical protein ACTJFD_08660 [Vagococcus sp.]
MDNPIKKKELIEIEKAEILKNKHFNLQKRLFQRSVIKKVKR